MRDKSIKTVARSYVLVLIICTDGPVTSHVSVYEITSFLWIKDSFLWCEYLYFTVEKYVSLGVATPILCKTSFSTLKIIVRKCKEQLVEKEWHVA